MNQIIIQGVGYLALIFVILSFQKNKRLNILLTMLVGLALFVLHYSLLHAWTGAVLNALEAAMVYVASEKETKAWAKQKFWPYFFVAAFIIAGLIVAQNAISYLPVLAQILSTIAVWQKNPRTIRYIMLAPRPLWFIYNFTVGSQAGVVAECLIFLSVAIGIIRFDVMGKKEG